MRKLTLLLFLCPFLNEQSMAQSQVAITAGAHSATVTPSYLTSDGLSSTIPRTGLHFGFLANLPFSNTSKFALQPGILYHEKGSGFETFLNNSQVTHKEAEQKLNYIDIPFNMVAKFPFSKKGKFIIGAGPQASIFYNGSLSTSAYFEDGSYVMNENKDLPVGSGEGQYKTVHVAANAIAGFELGRVFITAQYQKALTPFLEKENQSYEHQSIGASVGFFFGKQEKAKARIKDSDKDGIPDNEDACPSKAGIALTKGCPDNDADGIADAEDRCPNVAGTLKDKGCPVLDKDNDGIVDQEDACPNSAGSVKYKGCPVPDSDGDGINDEQDKCVNVKGARENSGCPVIEKSKPIFNQEAVKVISYAAKKIQFAFQKATLLPSSYNVLNDVVAVLKKHNDLKITIEGHTSGDYDEKANRKLSFDRADAVKNYLMQKGIASNRITVVGYGSGKPITNSKLPSEIAKNRRVELKLSN